MKYKAIMNKLIGIRSENPLLYSCLENSMDRGTWWATAQGVTKSGTRLSTHIQILKIKLNFKNFKS